MILIHIPSIAKIIFINGIQQFYVIYKYYGEKVSLDM